jgi:hypothetical protein
MDFEEYEKQLFYFVRVLLWMNSMKLKNTETAAGVSVWQVYEKIMNLLNSKASEITMYKKMNKGGQTGVENDVDRIEVPKCFLIPCIACNINLKSENQPNVEASIPQMVIHGSHSLFNKSTANCGIGTLCKTTTILNDFWKDPKLQ